VIVVSDTSPLNYLILIGAVDVLPQLFREVNAPPAVLVEMLHSSAPAAVRGWAQAPPSWMVVRSPTSMSEIASRLDFGEAEAISLAMELQADAILIDERKGRLIAEAQGLIPVGTLAVLEVAAEQKLLDLRLALDALRRTTFYVTDEVVEATLARDVARRSKP
jgi:predicted nucleic acid-binding protein